MDEKLTLAQFMRWTSNWLSVPSGCQIYIVPGKKLLLEMLKTKMSITREDIENMKMNNYDTIYEYARQELYDKYDFSIIKGHKCVKFGIDRNEYDKYYLVTYIVSENVLIVTNVYDYAPVCN